MIKLLNGSLKTPIAIRGLMILMILLLGLLYIVQIMQHVTIETKMDNLQKNTDTIKTEVRHANH